MDIERVINLVRGARDMANGSPSWRGEILRHLDEVLAELASEPGVVAIDSPKIGMVPGRVVEVDFHIGQTVAFRLSPSSVGMVTSIHVRDGSVAYGVTWDDFRESSHFAFEIRASDRPILSLAN